MGHTIPEICQPGQVWQAAVMGMALVFQLELGPPRAGELCGPCCGMAERTREAHQTPEVAPPGLGASLHYAGGICLDISVIPCPRDCAESPWACRAPTVPCSAGGYQLPAQLQLVCSCTLPPIPHFCLFLLCRHCSCHSNGYEMCPPAPAQWPISPHGH